MAWVLTPQALGEARPWTAAEGEPEVVDKAVEPRGATGLGRHHALVEALGKDPLAVERLVTAEPTRRQMETNAAARTGQIGDAPKVSAVNPTRGALAERARGLSRNNPRRDQDDVGIQRDTFDGQTRWDHGRQSKLPLHGTDLADDTATADQQTSSEVGQSRTLAPFDTRQVQCDLAHRLEPPFTIDGNEPPSRKEEVSEPPLTCGRSCDEGEATISIALLWQDFEVQTSEWIRFMEEKTTPIATIRGVEAPFPSRLPRLRLSWRENMLLSLPVQPSDLVPGLVIGLIVIGAGLKSFGLMSKHPSLFLGELGLIIVFVGAQGLPRSMRLRLARNPWLGFLDEGVARMVSDAQPSPLSEPIPLLEPDKVGKEAAMRAGLVSSARGDPFDRIRLDIIAHIDPRKFYRKSIQVTQFSARFSDTFSGHANN